MLRYIAHRLLVMIPTLLAISFVIFVVIKLPPGDFLSNRIEELRAAGEPADLEEVTRLRKEFRLDLPFHEQYFWFLWDLARDEIRSMEYDRPVSEIIGDRLWLSVIVSVATVIFTYLVAFPIGVYSATNQYSWGDHGLTFLGFLGLATPNFLLALVLVCFANVWFGTEIGGLMDEAGGLDEKTCAALRRAVTQALVAYRDRGYELPPRPSREQALAMLRTLVAAPSIDDEYGQWVVDGLMLDGVDPGAINFTATAGERAALPVLVIGCGESGLLAGIPWSMLPALVGRPFTLAASASRWARTELIAPESAGFAVGPRVARGAEEVSVAAAAWTRPRHLTEGEATVGAVSDLAGRVDLLHVAAHGRHAADNPLFSGLELQDGVLFGHDIDRIAAVPRIVILSACEVGRSSVRWGEEAVGMTRAWLHAGVDCVIAAPVIVADDDACELLGAVHAEIAAGEAPAVALARAQARTGITAPFQCHGTGF